MLVRILPSSLVPADELGEYEMMDGRRRREVGREEMEAFIGRYNSWRAMTTFARMAIVAMQVPTNFPAGETHGN
jgi:hypothetical protein